MGFGMRTSQMKIPKRIADSARLIGLVGLLLSSAAAADIYPVNGVWVAPNLDFPIGADEACFTIGLSGVEAIARKSIAEILIFNENKRYDLKQDMQLVSTLSSIKPLSDGYWITEVLDVRRRFWFRQKITYLLQIVDPTTIEIRNHVQRRRFVKCGPQGKLPI
jgi:hypothetical protein